MVLEGVADLAKGSDGLGGGGGVTRWGVEAGLMVPAAPEVVPVTACDAAVLNVEGLACCEGIAATAEPVDLAHQFRALRIELMWIMRMENRKILPSHLFSSNSFAHLSQNPLGFCHNTQIVATVPNASKSGKAKICRINFIVHLGSCCGFLGRRRRFSR